MHHQNVQYELNPPDMNKVKLHLKNIIDKNVKYQAEEKTDFSTPGRNPREKKTGNNNTGNRYKENSVQLLQQLI